MKTLFASLASIAAICFTAGCSSTATFDYQTAPAPMISFQNPGYAQKSIAVMPFLDLRGVKNVDVPHAALHKAHPAGDSGSFALGLIPLFPGGFVQKDEPENSDNFVSLGFFHFNPKQDLANAAALSLKKSNLFKDVVIANVATVPETDYIWRGSVSNTFYSGTIHTWFVTYLAAWPLWLLGAPYGTSENQLWVKFELIERASGNIVWSYDYRGRDYITHWIYARIGKDASMYPKLMKQAMNGALLDLSQKAVIN